MTLNRLVVGVAVLVALSVWCWSRPGAKQAHAKSHDTITTAEVDECAAAGNHDEQEYRYRTSQPRHWKHIMLGTR